MEGRRLKRRALCASLLLALLLIAAPGASAATCTAAAGGDWTSPATWSCGVAPGTGDAVLIPAGKTVSVAAADTQSAGTLTLRGTLALGDQAELDADGLVADGGTISGPQYAMLVVTPGAGEQATVAGAGLTVDGASLTVTGDGTFAVAGPLTLDNGGWVESDVDATWAGSAPWRIGGAAGSPPSGFEVFGAQLTINGATAAQPAGAGGGVIQLDGGSTLVKHDATTSELAVDVLIDSARVNVLAGKLTGDFQGAGSLAVAAGATLVLSGSGLQVAPPAVDVAGGTLEVAPDADISLVLPSAPALHRLAVGAGASLDVGIDDGTGGSAAEASPPAALANEVAIAAGATLVMSGGGGTLALDAHDVLGGSGRLDGSLQNGGGTVAPKGAFHVTGNYSQGGGATLALGLRSASDGDSLRVDGAVALAGTLEVNTRYTPVKTASELVLAAGARPSGTFAKVRAPLPSGLAWDPAYTAAGVTLGVAAGGAAPASVTRPSLLPAVPVVGGLTRCLPGTWTGAHALTFQWLRGGKEIAHASTPRRRVTAADLGRELTCRVTATGSGSARAAATSKPARAHAGLGIGAVTAGSGGALSVSL
ncbi:MAG: hypothetical protein QOD65_1938, partial [Gaiellales bacterium]|nr:hypothetical protein [Gaiellales bacterium]